MSDRDQLPFAISGGKCNAEHRRGLFAHLFWCSDDTNDGDGNGYQSYHDKKNRFRKASHEWPLLVRLFGSRLSVAFCARAVIAQNAMAATNTRDLLASFVSHKSAQRFERGA